MIETPKHKVSIVAGSVEVRDALTYQIKRSMTGGVDTFSMQFPFSRSAWEVLQPDAPIQVRIDDIPVLTGFLDDSDTPDAVVIDVTGRNKLGRFVQDCAPGISFKGLGIKELIEKIAEPLFARVVFENARNRNIARGRGKKARAAREPARLNTRVGTQIEPGQTRMQIITQLCEQAGYLVWESGDGKELIVGLPNYDQEPQFLFFRPAIGSTRRATVMEMPIRRSSGDRYSRVICVGSGQGTDANYGPHVASRYGEAFDSVTDFSAPKTLIIQRAVSSAAEARELAEAEMARRDAQADVVEVTAAGHGQLIAGTQRTLFTTDTIANVICERTGHRGAYLVEECTFEASRTEAATTSMTLVRKGAVLSR